MTEADIRKRIAALTRYRFDLYRINEDSDAALLEEDRVDLALCKLKSMLASPEADEVTK